MRAPVVLTALAVLSGGLGGALPVVTGSPAYAASTPVACRAVATPDDIGREAEESTVRYPDPFAEMGIAEAATAVRGRRPGAGVTVAVVDSGIDPRGFVVAPRRITFGGSQAAGKYFHGTTVAGLIAGRKGGGSPGGIAPGVTLLDMPVYRAPSEEDGDGEVVPSAVVGALTYLNDHLHDYPLLIVNLSLELDRGSPELRRQVERLVKRGAVVVAASGNRPSDDGSPAPYVGDEDARARVYPAAYPGVVAVGAVVTEGSPGDATAYVVANSRTDVVAPTYGARSVTLGGRSCVVDEVATSWSTAEVSGALALLASADPHATGRELVDRLVRTASGRPDVRGVFTGAGVVQAYDAVTRPLDKAGVASPGPVAEAHVVPPERDVLHGTRHATIWWGLIGGGALLLGLVLRPLLSRRR
ncbi:S8 family serine peptidase [Nocardioides sp. DS6]|uniref:S8 family serine peptidase n=1 Tax=Nocardioides eburneus TaxID=3231482 RepID=A0ABV3T217_9ACTN